MMKKMLSALLALSLMIGTAALAAAEAGGDVITLPETGVVMEKTEALKNARGTVDVSELSIDPAIPDAYVGIVSYLAMTEKEYAPIREAVERYNDAAWKAQETGGSVPEAVTNAAADAQEKTSEKAETLCYVLALPDGQT